MWNKLWAMPMQAGLDLRFHALSTQSMGASDASDGKVPDQDDQVKPIIGPLALTRLLSLSLLLSSSLYFLQD
ncbi:hypothetical protein RRF57_000285 [Xylaria bambusicola]|uniref:Uncharacterized protein n=1 Tax=Xylaria bambusicola TaxID=326684 RepID=A0AAN7UEA8_9PEZI